MEKRDVNTEDNFKRDAKVIYSDRSDTSVEELMEITPSAFNELNGRIDSEPDNKQGLMEINIRSSLAAGIRNQFQKGQKVNQVIEDDKPVVS